MSTVIEYFLTNVRNIVGVLFMILALVFGTRVEALKEPTLQLLVGIVDLISPASVDAQAVERFSDEVIVE